jgi:hypothetical protein
MKITRVSMVTNKVHTMEINCTADQIQSWLDGVFIQDAMPHLTPDEREFIVSGVTPEEWEEYFAESN